jgi:hypothetical protein
MLLNNSIETDQYTSKPPSTFSLFAPQLRLFLVGQCSRLAHPVSAFLWPATLRPNSVMRQSPKDHLRLLYTESQHRLAPLLRRLPRGRRRCLIGEEAVCAEDLEGLVVDAETVAV